MSTLDIAPGASPHVSTPGGEMYTDIIDLAKVKAAHLPFYTDREPVTADGNTAAAIAALQMWRCIIYPGFPITPSHPTAARSTA